MHAGRVGYVVVVGSHLDGTTSPVVAWGGMGWHRVAWGGMGRYGVGWVGIRVSH